ncbi:hypothetical protein K523DRAFT_351938 [Schizophyllum commune Tattone D]|nr:hypothetical protein K523DRAFT_351938 [Schizophyllum commune Tattone D]
MSSGHHRPTRVLALAFKHGPSLHFKRPLATFLKRVFVLAFGFAFTFKLILGLKLIVLKRALSCTTPTR